MFTSCCIRQRWVRATRLTILLRRASAWIRKYRHWAADQSNPRRTSSHRTGGSADHLRTYVEGGGNVHALHRAFVETANTYPASPDKLAKFCGCLGDLAAAGGIPFTPEDVVAYFEKIAQDGYPAIHHSAAFRLAYQPAYRVVAVDLL